MSTRRTIPSQGSPRHLHGNQQLYILVGALAVILIVLGVFAYFSQKNPATSVLTNTSDDNSNSTTQNKNTAPAPASQPNTPTGRTSFVGTVKQVKKNSLTVETIVTKNEVSQNVTITVTLPDEVRITKPGSVPKSIPIPGSPAPTIVSTTASLADIVPGATVSVQSDRVIDDAANVTATVVTILSTPSH